MPPRFPVTIDDRMTAICGAAMMACIVFAVGFAIHKAISKNSEIKRIQGHPIVWRAWMADNRRNHLNEVVGGMGGFGSLAGLAIGNIHGSVEDNVALW